MEIKRLDGYTDKRFSGTVLRQHGGYLVAGEPYEVEIVSRDAAVVRGGDPGRFPALIEEFRFHAPHIVRFADARGETVAEFAPAELVEVGIGLIQPSQFYVDEEKLAAVSTFISGPGDIVIQAKRHGERYIALDGHTRLFLAVQRGYESVKAVLSESDDWVWAFVREARRRGINSPRDMELVSHEEYTELWDRYCDEVFGAGGQEPDRDGEKA